jgi:small multidrug resistance family-3 protein
MSIWGWLFLAALAEIGGCYAFWSWLRLGASRYWLLPGMVSLALFATFLTRVDMDAQAAGRTYAVYGGIYIVSSLLWLWLVERNPPSRWDLLGGLVSVAGAVLIVWGNRKS